MHLRLLCGKSRAPKSFANWWLTLASGVRRPGLLLGLWLQGMEVALRGPIAWLNCKYIHRRVRPYSYSTPFRHLQNRLRTAETQSKLAWPSSSSSRQLPLTSKYILARCERCKCQLKFRFCPQKHQTWPTDFIPWCTHLLSAQDMPIHLPSPMVKDDPSQRASFS